MGKIKVDMKKYILCVDQGTTSTRSIVYDNFGNVVSSASKGITQYYPHPGWVEHNPEEIYDSVIVTAVDALTKADVSIKEIEGIGITNQRETTVVWDRSGTPAYNAIVWQCRRTAELCKSLEKQYGSEIYSKTGLKIDAYFSATKLKWILDNVAGARERAQKGELLFGTIDSYILYRLTGGKVHATDYTNASRTMLYDIHNLRWDKSLLKIFDIPECMLPKVYPSSHEYGYATEFRIPVLSIAGDQQASLFGHLCVGEGMLKTTYGTGCFMLMNTGDKAISSKNGLLTTLAASISEKPQYALEGSVFMGGATVQWLRDELKIIDTAAQSEQCALNVGDNGGVYLVPAFTGLGAPYWDGDARAAIVGLTRGTGRDHIVRAALEGIAYQVCDVAFAMEQDAGKKILSLEVDGGATANDFLMQFQSDMLAAPVIRPENAEVTTLGVFYLSALKCGMFSSVAQLTELTRRDDVFYPSANERKRVALLEGWKTAVKRVR